MHGAMYGIEAKIAKVIKEIVTTEKDGRLNKGQSS
jgi:hypothetical protein